MVECAWVAHQSATTGGSEARSTPTGSMELRASKSLSKTTITCHRCRVITGKAAGEYRGAKAGCVQGSSLVLRVPNLPPPLLATQEIDRIFPYDNLPTVCLVKFNLVF